MKALNSTTIKILGKVGNMALGGQIIKTGAIYTLDNKYLDNLGEFKIKYQIVEAGAITPEAKEGEDLKALREKAKEQEAKIKQLTKNYDGFAKEQTKIIEALTKNLDNEKAKTKKLTDELNLAIKSNK